MPFLMDVIIDNKIERREVSHFVHIDARTISQPHPVLYDDESAVWTMESTKPTIVKTGPTPRDEI